MITLVDRSLAALATRAGPAAWLDPVLAVSFVAAGATILLGLLLQVWVPAVQLRRFARAFSGRPEAVEAFNRLFAIYGWRARLACKLFSIPVPPGFQAPGSNNRLD